MRDMLFPNSSPDCRRRPAEQGAVIIMLALMLLAIVGFLALALEIPQLSGAQHKKYQTAQLAGLGFLSAYNSATVDSSGTSAQQHAARMAAGMQRLSEIVGFEGNSLQFGSMGRQSKTGEFEIKDMSGTLSNYSHNIAGSIRVGDWYFEEPSSTCAELCKPPAVCSASCPCHGGTWNGECFAPAAAGATNVSAIEVTLKSKPTSPFKFVFGRVLGLEELPITARARVSVTSRVFLTGIDLSRSITFDTHIPWDQLLASSKPAGQYALGPAASSNIARASEYVFPLTGSGSSKCASSSDHSNPCTTTGIDRTNPTAGCQFSEPAGQNYFHMIYYSLASSGNHASADETTHFQSDYTCWVINNKHFLIDTSIHTAAGGVSYRGPRPLVDVLASFGEVMSEMDLRSVSGDSMVLFGFDKDADLGGPRFLGPLNPKTPGTTWSDLKALTEINQVTTMDATHLTEDSRLKKRLVDHQFFPNPDTGATDLAGALFSIHKLLKNIPSAASGTVQISLFTDGLANVTHDDPFMKKVNGEPELTNDNLDHSACDSTDWTTLWYTDANCFMKHAYSVADAIALVTNDSKFKNDVWWGDRDDKPESVGFVRFGKRNVHINIALFGTDVQPHILLKKSKTKPTQCMDDLDARKTYYPLDREHYQYMDEADFRNLFAHDGRFWTNDGVMSCYFTLGSSQSCKYITNANALWRGIVLPTGGRFVPVRPSCDAALVSAKTGWSLTTASCKLGELENKLNSAVCAPYNGENQPDPWFSGGFHEEYTINYQSPVVGTTVQKLKTAGVLDDQVLFWFQQDNPPAMEDKGNEEFDTRIICDTKCRSAEEQLRDLYRELFASNPYVFVRDDT